MEKRTWKRIALTVLSVFLMLVGVLVVHIYVVTRPRVDGNTRVMARIDIKQPVTPVDADRITAWLYQQKGVDHVMVNQQSATVIFTYAPIKNDGNQIAQNFRASLPYSNAARYIPTEQEMKSGCPVNSSSFGYKLASYVKHIF